MFSASESMQGIKQIKGKFKLNTHSKNVWVLFLGRRWFAISWATLIAADCQYEVTCWKRTIKDALYQLVFDSHVVLSHNKAAYHTTVCNIVWLSAGSQSLQKPVTDSRQKCNIMVLYAGNMEI